MLLASGGGLLHAQTNVNATLQPVVRMQTVITSECGFFSNGARQIIYSGKVRVDDPQMKLTCEQLTADFPQSGGHIDHLVAVTNVVMDAIDEKGQKTHATSDKTIYDYKVQNGVTNEIITLTGHARAENDQIILYGEPIIYNRITGDLRADKPHTIIKQNLSAVLSNTNALTTKTNLPPAAMVPPIHPTTNAPPVVKTNLPPPVIEPVIQGTNVPVTITNSPEAKTRSVNPKNSVKF